MAFFTNIEWSKIAGIVAAVVSFAANLLTIYVVLRDRNAGKRDNDRNDRGDDDSNQNGSTSIIVSAAVGVVSLLLAIGFGGYSFHTLSNEAEIATNQLANLEEKYAHAQTQVAALKRDTAQFDANLTAARERILSIESEFREIESQSAELSGTSKFGDSLRQSQMLVATMSRQVTQGEFPFINVTESSAVKQQLDETDQALQRAIEASGGVSTRLKDQGTRLRQSIQDLSRLLDDMRVAKP